jgi:Terminase large subunit, T4likevirus-type, N-terminal
MPYPIHPRNKTKLIKSSGRAIISTIKETFQPNPGGQETFFDLIGLPTLTSPPTIDHRFVYLCGGVGSGKTMCGAAFIAIRAIFDPTSRSLITANTYGQLETSTIPGFVEFCDRHNITLNPRRETVEETAKAITARRLCQISIRLDDREYKASILVLSAEAFTARTQNAKTPGAGLQVRSIWADEFSTAEKSAFDVLNDRLGRGEGTLKGLGIITSTINKYNPYNWTYDLFDDPDRDELKRKLFRSIVVRTSENIKLDDDYYGSVAAGLTDEHRRIQLEAEYVAVTEGRLINTFDRAKHVLKGAETKIIEHNPAEPIHVALDFNRSPATASAWQVMHGEIRGLREWYLIESDTFALGESIADWVKSMQNRCVVQLYGDASGNQKTANSRNTNWQIIKDALSSKEIRFRYCVDLANPSIADSVNGLKFQFGKNSVYLNGDTQKELIKDLESVRWDDKGGIEKKDAARTHLLDGLRYMVWQLYPYRSTPRAGMGDGRQTRIPGLIY